MNSSNQIGVSVILCCFNSARRIKHVLQALSKQEVDNDIHWEIIMVDNASTDNTALLARATWDAIDTNVELKIIFEQRQGLANARMKGIDEAAYEYLVFCDDDNWLFPDYIQRSFTTLNIDNNVAACGGCGIAKFETKEPAWFKDYAEAFAIGSQELNAENGKILSLYGAGLAIKKSKIIEISATGFKHVLSGRVGNKLSSSEDIEMTHALVLLGYDLQYDDNLKFYHYLPIRRLNFSYLNKLFIEFGNDGPIRNLYYANISKRFLHRRIRNWYFHVIFSLVRLVKYAIIPPKKNGRNIYFNWNKAYISSLFRIKQDYQTLQQNINKLKTSSRKNSSLKIIDNKIPA